MSENTIDAGEAVKRWFDTMPDPMEARVMAFAGEDRSGFIIKWAKKGIGFGEFTISIDNKTMEVHTDDECMGAEFIAETFRALCNWKDHAYLCEEAE